MLLKNFFQFVILAAVLAAVGMGCVATGYVAGYDQYGRPVIVEPVYVPTPVYVPAPVYVAPGPYYYGYYGYRHHHHRR
jgi:DNA-binding transcriptional LysR family regulator